MIIINRTRLNEHSHSYKTDKLKRQRSTKNKKQMSFQCFAVVASILIVFNVKGEIMAKLVSFVVPVFNEEDNINEFYKHLTTVMAKEPYD